MTQRRRNCGNATRRTPSIGLTTAKKLLRSPLCTTVADMPHWEEDAARNSLVYDIRRYPRWDKPDSSDELVHDWDKTMHTLLTVSCCVIVIGYCILGAHMYWRLVSEWAIDNVPYVVCQCVLTCLALAGTAALFVAKGFSTNAVNRVDEAIHDVVTLVRDLLAAASNGLSASAELRNEVNDCIAYKEQLGAVNSTIEELYQIFDQALDPLELYHDHLQPMSRYFRTAWWFLVMLPWLVMLVSAMCTRNCSRERRSFEVCTYVWTVMVQLPIALMIVASSVAVAIGLADFCFLGPAAALRAANKKNELIAYYLTCPGDPAHRHPVRYAVTNATVQVDSLLRKEWSECMASTTDNVVLASGVSSYRKPELSTTHLVNAQAILETRIAHEVESISNVTLSCSFEYLQPALEDFVYGSVCSRSLRAVYSVYVTIAAVGFLALIIILPIVNRRWRVVEQAMLTLNEHGTFPGRNDGKKSVWKNEVRLARARHIVLKVFKRQKRKHNGAEDEEFNISDAAVRGHKSHTNDSEVSCWSNVSYVDIQVESTVNDEDDASNRSYAEFDYENSPSDCRWTSPSSSVRSFITTPTAV